MKGLMRKREQRFGHGKEFAKAIEQSCPEMFEEEKIAVEMEALFEDKIATTRALLELANSDDTGGMTKAVEALAVEEQGEGATPKPKRTSSTTKQKATPMPREGLPRGRSSGKLPRITDQDFVDEDTNTDPPKKTKGTDRYQSKVARDYAMYDRSDAETEQAEGRDVPAKRTDTQDIPKVRGRRPPPKEEKSGGGFGGILFGVLFVGLVGGLVWAGWKGPLKDSGPAVAARAYLDKEINGEPPPAPPPPLDQVKPTGAKPQWLIEKEAKDEQDRAEAAKQKAIEEAANDPETKKQLEEINAQLKELDHQEAELRQLKIDAHNAGAQGAANTQRIEKLEKEIDDLKKSIAVKQAQQKKKKALADGEVEIVRDTRSAKNADVGYLTLFTINPSHAAVFEGGTSLGTTPLSKVPLDEGHHTLRVVDDESHNRTFEVQVKAGQVTELKGVDVSTMALSK
jgi:serine/threonine-protein kinase